jgi:hypothetical protein
VVWYTACDSVQRSFKAGEFCLCTREACMACMTRYESSCCVDWFFVLFLIQSFLMCLSARICTTRSGISIPNTEGMQLQSTMSYVCIYVYMYMYYTIRTTHILLGIVQYKLMPCAVCVCMCVCMHVCLHTYVWMYVCIHMSLNGI